MEGGEPQGLELLLAPLGLASRMAAASGWCARHGVLHVSMIAEADARDGTSLRRFLAELERDGRLPEVVRGALHDRLLLARSAVQAQLAEKFALSAVSPPKRSAPAFVIAPDRTALRVEGEQLSEEGAARASAFRAIGGARHVGSTSKGVSSPSASNGNVPVEVAPNETTQELERRERVKEGSPRHATLDEDEGAASSDCTTEMELRFCPEIEPPSEVSVPLLSLSPVLESSFTSTKNDSIE